MNAPLVLRRVRGDFTAGVHVLGRLEPGRFSTTHYDPYHGAGLIVWQDRSNYLRLERAVGFINGRHRAYINYELRTGGRLAVSRGIPNADGSLFLKLRRQGEAFSAWYSHDGRRWVELGGVDATFAERVEVGVVAVNSSKRTLSAELEWLSIEDPQGSMARDYADPDSDEPSRIPPASNGGIPVLPIPTSVLIEPGPGEGRPAPLTTEWTGFHWWGDAQARGQAPAIEDSHPSETSSISPSENHEGVYRHFPRDFSGREGRCKGPRAWVEERHPPTPRIRPLLPDVRRFEREATTFHREERDDDENRST